MWEEREIMGTKKEHLFDITTVRSRSFDGQEGTFIKVTPPDWVVVIPRLPNGKYLMVRQYRHGSACLSDEFPAGVMDPHENPLEAALRELREETGYRAGKITKIGEINPNPAFMTNRSYTFFAEDLIFEGIQELDHDERIHFFEEEEEVIENSMGKGNYCSAIMVQAWFWLKKHYEKSSN